MNSPTGSHMAKNLKNREHKRFNSPVSVKETKPSLAKQTERPKLERIRHYLAAQANLMMVNKPYKIVKRKRKISPIPSFDDISDILKTNLSYEHRTVNSLADETEVLEPSNIFQPEAPRKRLKKRKPGFIDSEVDLMKSKERRPSVALAIIKKNLSAIQELGSENGDETNKKKRKKKMPSSKSPVSRSSTSRSPTSRSPTFKPPLSKSEISKPSSVKIKKISPNMSKQVSGSSGQQSNPSEKYPVLRNEELVQRFLNVDFTNNQKGRIRQVIKDILRGTSPNMLPDVINNKIQAILKSSENLTDSDLRKIRVLYNMLKKATEDIKQKSDLVGLEDLLKNSNENNPRLDGQHSKDSKEVPLNSSKNPVKAKANKSSSKEDKQKTKADTSKREKKPLKEKRYVVFLGNLPIDVTREQIFEHFSDIREYIKDVRLPQLAEDKRSSIAYVEFDNAPVYEMALSRHHSMMGKKRINVLYTSPNKKGKISKTEAKAKSAKLRAMAKSGQLAGSVPAQRKRSHRRAKAREYQRATELAEKELNSISLS